MNLYRVHYKTIGNRRVDLGLFWGETEYIAADKAHSTFRLTYPFQRHYKAVPKKPTTNHGRKNTPANQRGNA